MSDWCAEGTVGPRTADCYEEECREARSDVRRVRAGWAHYATARRLAQARGRTHIADCLEAASRWTGGALCDFAPAKTVEKALAEAGSEELTAAKRKAGP